MVPMFNKVDELHVTFTADPVKAGNGAYKVGDVLIPAEILAEGLPRTAPRTLRFKPNCEVSREAQVSPGVPGCVVIEWTKEDVWSVPIDCLEKIEARVSVSFRL